MDSSNGFSNLALTPEDYIKDDDSPYQGYNVLRDGLYRKISDDFNERVASKFATDEWTVSHGYGMWDANKEEILVLVTPKIAPRNSFMMNYHVPKRLHDSSMKNPITITARILRYKDGMYNGVLMDDLLSGTGHYNPELWAQEAFEVTHAYVFHGVLPSGW